MTPDGGALLALAGAAGSDAAARPLTLAVALGALGLVPLLFMSLTAFVKISTVLHIARSALGAPEVPSGPILLALSFALALVAMAPVGTRIGERVTPLLASIEHREAAEWLPEVARAVREPMTHFLRDNAAERHKDQFGKLLRKRAPEAEPDDLRILVPAFLVTELMEAFLMGFAIYLPFLVVDLVVANVLAALGLAGLSPERVSLPFKLLLFVAADGWTALAQSLVTGYRV